MKKTKAMIMGLPFITFSQSEFVTLMKQRIKQQQKTWIVTANPEIVMYADTDAVYKTLLQEKADFITPDGIGIVKAAKVLNLPIYERVTGYDTLLEFLKIANTEKLNLFLVGAKPEVIQKAKENIERDYPDLNLVGVHDGYFDSQTDDLIDEIAAMQPDMVFAGLGFPNQDIWLERYSRKVDKGILMGVGGSFDVLSGTVKRAPEAFQKVHLEWFYRLLKEPTRAKRMLVLPQFMIEIYKRKRSGDHS